MLSSRQCLPNIPKHPFMGLVAATDGNDDGDRSRGGGGAVKGGGSLVPKLLVYLNQ